MNFAHTRAMLGLVVALFATSAVEAAGLTGSQVQVSAYDLAASSPAARAVEVTVGPGTEVPDVSTMQPPGEVLVPASVDISELQISLDYLAGGNDFANGYVFLFSGIVNGVITGATFNSASSVSFESRSVGFNSGSVFFALYGANAAVGDRLVVDVQVSEVPEPMSAVLLLGGLGAVGLVR